MQETFKDWLDKNPVEDKMFWSGAFWDQVRFMRSTISGLLWSRGIGEDDENSALENKLIKVISTHCSKSIHLPVYQISIPSGYGVAKVTMRDNFHDWKVSVDSPVDIAMLALGIFDPEKEIHSCYCEGFPEEFVFGSYEKNKKQFTVEMHSDYQVYVFMWQLLNSLGIGIFDKRVG